MIGVLFSWWLAIEVLGIVGLPLTATLLANLPDRGWSLSKPLSLLALGWLIWFPLSLITALPFSQGWIIGTFVVFTVGNAALLRRRELRLTVRRLLTRHWRYLALNEGLFAGAFALMAWVRSFTPAVVDTEKFMDEAFLSAIWRAPHLPPPDPWLSGYSINYYYFGHYLMALVAKTLGTQPSVAFNVSVALIFALTATAIFGVATNIVAVGSSRGTRERRLLPASVAGFASVVLTLIAGNLNGAQIWYHDATLLTGVGKPLHENPWAWWANRAVWPSYDWWSPSRVIPNTINEFPAFSFVLADLHAHVLALPFAALAVGLAFNLLLADGVGIAAFGRGALGMLCLLVSGVTLGALYAINGWDLPTYLGLALLALAIQQWLAHDRVINGALLIDLGTAAVMLVALAFICYFPFYTNFSSPSQGVGLVPATAHTPIGYEIAIFGLPLFLAVSLLITRVARQAGDWSAGAQLLPGMTVALGLLLTMASPNAGVWTLLWGLALIGVCVWLALRMLGFRLAWGAQTHDDAEGVQPKRLMVWSERGELWVYLLIGTATALIVACELIYLRDIFGGPLPNGQPAPYFRMNTVFKLYYQAWLLFGIASGPVLVWLARAAGQAIGAGVGSASFMWREVKTGIAGGNNRAHPGIAHAIRTSPSRLRKRIGGVVQIALAFNVPYALAVKAASANTTGRSSGKGGKAGKGKNAAAQHGRASETNSTAASNGENGTTSARKTTKNTGSAQTQQTSRARPALQARQGSSSNARQLAKLPTQVEQKRDAPSLDVAEPIIIGDETPEMPEHEPLGAPPHRDNVTMLALGWAQAGLGALWLIALIGLLAAALIYPTMAVAARSQNATLPHSLDGTSYMAYDDMNQGDQYAIAWLNTHVSSDSVIVEAASYSEYTHFGRISAFTGMPTLIGWGGHEVQWRYNWLAQPAHSSLINQRLDAVNQIYTNPNNGEVLALLHQYNVRFVYVGSAERNLYNNANLGRFATFLHVVYQYDGVTIYAVPE